MRTALLALMLAAGAGFKGKGVKDFRASEWMPLFDEPSRDAGALVAEQRKDMQRLKLGLRALVKGRVRSKTRKG